MKMEDDNSSDDDELNNRIKPTITNIENQNNSRKRNFKNYPKPFEGDIVEWTDITTIHGVKYLGEPRRPWAEKVVWILIFIMCFSFLGYFVFTAVTKWKRTPVILVEDDLPTEIFNIPFPAVTICPQIKLKYNKFSYELLAQMGMRKDKNITSIPDLQKKLEMAFMVCHKYVNKMIIQISRLSLSKTIDPSYIELLRELSPNQDEIITGAVYKTNSKFFFGTENGSGEDENANDRPSDDDDNEDAKKLFSTVLTNEGVCFTFNTPKEILREDLIQKAYKYNDFNITTNHWDSENGYNFDEFDFDYYPAVIFGAGKDFGLQLHLKTNVRDMNRLCQPTEVGFKIALHSPSVYPTTYEDYILVNFDKITNIAVEPKLIKTSEGLRMYTPERRQCYFANEKRLKYFAYYNKVNCKLECLSNYTMKNYKCVHFSMPMDPGTPICGAKPHTDGAYSQMYSYAENMESLANFIEKILPVGKLDRVNDLQLECDCLPECNSIEYAYNVESEKFDYFKMYAKVQEALNVTDQMDEILTEVNIFFKNTLVYGKTRNQLYTFADLVSNFGGLMGLFMGASMISLIEFIYYCCIRQFCNTKRSVSPERQ